MIRKQKIPDLSSFDLFLAEATQTAVAETTPQGPNRALSLLATDREGASAAHRSLTAELSQS